MRSRGVGPQQGMSASIRGAGELVGGESGAMWERGESRSLRVAPSTLSQNVVSRRKPWISFERPPPRLVVHILQIDSALRISEMRASAGAVKQRPCVAPDADVLRVNYLKIL